MVVTTGKVLETGKKRGDKTPQIKKRDLVEQLFCRYDSNNLSCIHRIRSQAGGLRLSTSIKHSPSAHWRTSLCIRVDKL